MKREQANRCLKFTQARCLKLSGPSPDAKSSQIEYTDTEVAGFKLAVTKSGERVYAFRATFQGEKLYLRIGYFSSVSLIEAREQAKGYAASIDRGLDPRKQAVESKVVKTLAEFVQGDYLPFVTQRKRSYKADESKLRVHILPKFGASALDAITTYELQQYLGGIAQSHCNATSNRHLALFSAIFGLAVEWNFITVSPCVGLKKLRENPPPARNYTTDEMARVLAALKTDANTHAAAVLTFLIFTGLRLNEALSARWDQVDFERKQLFLGDTKAGKSRYVPLNDNALQVLRQQQKMTVSVWVFPGKDPEKPLNTPRKAWCRALTKAGVAYARIHDIRHSFASFCVESGASLYAVQHLLGHSSPVTTQRYAHLTQETLRDVSGTAMQGLTKNTP